LEFNKSKASLIKKSVVSSCLSMLVLAFGLSLFFHYAGFTNYRTSLLNAIPLCIISSAIAIPSVKALSKKNKEFIIYESSLSDIIGVLFFNFVALNATFGLASIGHFFAAPDNCNCIIYCHCGFSYIAE
jgi:hypothetical protein